MSNKTDEEYRIVRQLTDLLKTLDNKFERDSKRLKKAELKLNKLNSDEKIDLAMELIKSVFEKSSFLDIKQKVYFLKKERENINENVIWEDILNKLESHMKY